MGTTTISWIMPPPTFSGWRSKKSPSYFWHGRRKAIILKHAQNSSVLPKNAFPQGKLLPEHHLNFYQIIRKATSWPGERKSPNLVTWF